MKVLPESKRGKIIAISGAAAVVIAIAVILVLALGSKPSITITGTFEKQAGVMRGYGGLGYISQPCSQDLAAGSEVTATDSSGKVIGVTHLGSGTAAVGQSCDFPFAFQSLPYSDFYGFQVAGQNGTARFSYDELKSGNFDIKLSMN